MVIKFKDEADVIKMANDSDYGLGGAVWTLSLIHISLQRWINMIFASSPFVNADHVLQAYNRNPDKTNLSDFHLDNTRSSLIKFCIFYLPESNVNVNLDALWNLDPERCV